MFATVSQDAVVLLAIGALWLAALIAPGPDFLLVTRVSITQGRPAATSASLGIAVGIATWGIAGYFGIHAMFVAAPWLYAALKIGGGAYLAVLGLRLLAASWRVETANEPATPVIRTRHAFRLGLITNLANPKAPLFVSSLFAATLPPHPPAILGVLAVAIMFVLTMLWYVFVGRVLTVARVARVFARARRWIDRAAGVAFMAFGTRLVLDRSA